MGKVVAAYLYQKVVVLFLENWAGDIWVVME